MTLYTCAVCGKSTHVDTSKPIVFTNCMLTDKCLGKLYKDTNVGNVTISKQTNNRIKLDVITQKLLSKRWISAYKVNTMPIVYVYKLNANGTHSQIYSGFSVTISSNNELVIQFTTATAGIAHIVYNTSFRLSEQLLPSTQYTPLSVNGILTIASTTFTNSITKQLTYLNTDTNTNVTTGVDFIAHQSNSGITLFNTPWQTSDIITIGDVKYKVYSCNVRQTLPLSLNVPWSVDFGSDVILLSADPYQSPQDCILNTTCKSKATGVMNPPNLDIDGSLLYEYYPNIKFKSSIFD